MHRFLTTPGIERSGKLSFGVLFRKRLEHSAAIELLERLERASVLMVAHAHYRAR